MKYLLKTIQGDPKTFASFRLSELDSLCKLFNCPVPCYDPATLDEGSPFIHVELPSEEQASQIIRRSVLIRGVYECWGTGSTFEECAEDVLNSQDTMSAWMKDDKSFCVRIEGYGVSYTDKEQEAIRQKFKDLPFKGSVKLKKPDTQLLIFSDVGHRTYEKKEDIPKGKPLPKRAYFCRELWRDKRQEYNSYSLKKRLYLGPTSTSADLAFLMANQGLCKKGDVIFDPFVGTGSLLISCAHFGCVCVGSDIDWRVLHGKQRGKVHNIYDNFKQYKLPRPELICSDLYEPMEVSNTRYPDGF